MIFWYKECVWFVLHGKLFRTRKTGIKYTNHINSHSFCPFKEKRTHCCSPIRESAYDTIASLPFLILPFIDIDIGLIHSVLCGDWKVKKKVTLLICGWVLVSLSFLFFLSLTVSQLAEMHVNMVKLRLRPVVKKAKRKQRVTQTPPPVHFDSGWWQLISHLHLQFFFKAFSILLTSELSTVKAPTFQSLPVWFHSPRLFFCFFSVPPKLVLDFNAPWMLLPVRVSSPFAVSSTLSVLAGQKRQSAGDGLGCQSVPPPHWATGSHHRVFCYVDITFREDNEKEER